MLARRYPVSNVYSSPVHVYCMITAPSFTVAGTRIYM